MSKQRYLLVLLGVLLSAALYAQTGFTLHNELLYSTDGNTNGIFEAQVLSMEALAAPNTRISVRNDLYALGKNRGNHAQGFYDRLRVSGLHRQAGWKLGAGAAATLYGDPDQLAMYPEWQPLAVQEKSNGISTYLSFGKELSRFELSGHAQLNSLSMDTAEFSFDDFGFHDTGRISRSDYHGGALLQADFGKGFGAFAGLDHQDSDAESKRFRLSGTKLGMQHYARINRQFALESLLMWQHREAEALPGYKRNIYVSDLRLRMNLSPDLKGYVQFINRSCSDAQLSQLWLISNYLRGQLKYSFYYDESAASYLSLGALYSPQNEADAVFAESDLRLHGPFYAGAGINLRPNRQTELCGKLSYHLSPSGELNLQHRYRKNEVDSWKLSYTGLGLSLYY